ncbi:hypothetical protein SASPL_154738 [Salvia splendens]|uniref:Nucleoside-triphosphatase n=1 Tax=Salvia splendens TaxID=180675 RepID=A0A8X8W0L9_SALSN|nr:hypothetical protein SASPL_154738 [Salvia splendens]
MLSRHRVSGSGENYFDNPSSGCPQTIHSQLKNSGFLYSYASVVPFSIVLREVREGCDRVGFEVVTVDGRRGPLASTIITSRESHKWPNVGRYKVDVSSFESLALPELEVKEDTDLFIIDEVGKMELFSASFFPAVLRVLESNIPLLATVPVPKSGRDIPGGTWLSQI